MPIRQLDPADAAALQSLWLRALRDHPEAFAASLQDEQRRTLESVAQQLADGPPLILTFGAVEQGALAAMARLFISPYRKARHRASLGSMYVAPEWRGHGIAQQLLTAIIAHAESLGYVRDIKLAVTVGNASARNLYLRTGFVPYSIEPAFIFEQGQWYDIEWMLYEVRR